MDNMLGYVEEARNTHTHATRSATSGAFKATFSVHQLIPKKCSNDYLIYHIVISAGNDRYQDCYDDVEFPVLDTTNTQA